MLHIIGVPLLILGCIGVGFVLVYLKQVLLPFIVSVFIVYLLRPLVEWLTTPFVKVRRWWCAATPLRLPRG
jgi:predicted PurR-regulated permease PerM